MATPANAVTTIIDYHDETKHHFQQYARSTGYLDWANQPHPFREYSGTGRIELARDIEPTPIAYRRLFEPGCMPPHPVDCRSVSLLLRYSLALSAWKQAGTSRWALRVNPSSGNLHPTEGYLVSDSLVQPHQPTLYHYTSETHALERRAVFTTAVWRSLTADLPAGSFLVGLTSILWREAWKYGERAFRYCQHDVGHALAALRFSAGMLGWHLRLLTAWSTSDIGRLLGTDRHDDFRADEHEEPELLAVIVPHRGELKMIDLPPSEQTLTAIGESEWFGRANQLSAEYVDWPLIAAAATATRKPRGRPVAEPSQASVLPKGVVPKGNEPPDDVEAHRMIFQRRSAVSLDGTSHISLDTFLAMLTRTLPGPHPPWDVLTWPAAIDLVLFVHRVKGLAPGLYVLVRDAGRRDTLQRAMRESFAWQRPAGAHAELPLYLLKSADCRAAAQTLSCHQEIAADGFFSLGMLADFEGPIDRHGGWFYRQLFWEAGVVGQVLYLEAEAWGVRATGIGCYFDDPVHELLGLRAHQFQCLYHFTVGVPVDDLRLQTWPPYGARGSHI
jgi:SagB-type dehydrogenase family enzyme